MEELNELVCEFSGLVKVCTLCIVLNFYEMDLSSIYIENKILQISFIVLATIKVESSPDFICMCVSHFWLVFGDVLEVRMLCIKTS